MKDGEFLIVSPKPSRCPHLKRLRPWEDPAWMECRAQELARDAVLVKNVRLPTQGDARAGLNPAGRSVLNGGGN